MINELKKITKVNIQAAEDTISFSRLVSDLEFIPERYPEYFTSDETVQDFRSLWIELEEINALALSSWEDMNYSNGFIETWRKKYRARASASLAAMDGYLCSLFEQYFKIRKEKETSLLLWLQHWYDENLQEKRCFNAVVNITADCDSRDVVARFDLSGTYLDADSFTVIENSHGPDDWLICYTKDGYFEAAGDADKIVEILTVFKEWAEHQLQQRQ